MMWRRGRISAVFAALMILSAAASADTYYYRLNGIGPSTAPTPPPPSPTGEFQIAVQGANVAVRGQPYSATTYTYNAAPGAVMYSVSSGALPDGVSMNSGTGYISGSPNINGTYTATVKAVDSSGAVATASLSMDSVDPLAVSGNPGTLIVAGTAYYTSFFAYGGSQPYNFTVQGNPADLSLSPGGTSASLSGAPETPGNYPITVTVTEAHGLTASYPFTLKILPRLTIAGTPPSPATVGQPYNFAFSANGGQPPYNFGLSASSLPAGITLNPSTGTLSGTPFVAQTKAGIQIRVTDSLGLTATTAPFTIVTQAGASQPLAVNGSPPNQATVGVPYATQFTASGGGGAPYTFASTGSFPPAGLAVNPTSGVLAGTPTAVGNFVGMQVTATDALGGTATFGPFSITVAPAPDPLAITGSPAPSGTVGSPYFASFSASGGSRSGYSFALSAGALPAGLSLGQSTGTITGTPNAPGEAAGLIVSVTDSAGATASSSPFSISIAAAASPLSLSGSPPSSGATGVPYFAQFSASGGSGGYVYSLSSGALPPGLSLDQATGSISGAPSSVGSSTGLAITVADSAGETKTSSTFSIAIYEPVVLSGSAPSPAQIGQPYTAQFTASGGAGGYVFSTVNGNLPAGLTIDGPSGSISGTPSTPGDYTFRVRVTSSDGQIATSDPITVSAVQSALSISGTPSATAVINENYTSQFAAAGGDGSYTFSVASGALPPGISLAAADGSLYGLPTTLGTYTDIVVKVVSGDGQTATSAPFTITVGNPPLSVFGTPSPSASLGQFYLAFFRGAGGDGNYSYSFAGSLPPGVSANGSFLMGTPTQTGTYSGLQMTVTDSTGASASTPVFSIAVSDPDPITVSGSPATTTQALTDYSAQWTASGGNPANYVFAISGTLPNGLSFDPSSGILSGTPTVTGNFGPYTVSVSDGMRSAAAAPFNLTVTTGYGPVQVALIETIVNGVSVPATPVTQPAVTNQIWQLHFAVTGGRAPSGYNVSLDGDIPNTWSASANQEYLGIHGIGPGSEGTYGPLRLKAVDADGRIAYSDYFTITVTSPLQISGTPTQPVPGVPYSGQVTATGGVPPYTFSANNNAFYVSVPRTEDGVYHPTWIQWTTWHPYPSGAAQLTIDPTTGIISGTPVVGNNEYPIAAVQVTDSLGQTAFSWLNWSIANTTPLSISWAPQSALKEGVPYSASVQTTGGTPAYVYSLPNGSLPNGLSLDASTGTISGIPAPGTAGYYRNIAVRVTDTTNTTADTVLVGFTVYPATQPALSIAGTPATSTTTAAPYYATFTASGGSPGYVYSFTGTLPPGLVFNSVSGTISGTATQVGNYPNIVVSVHDSASPTPATVSAAAFSISVSNALAVNGVAQPNASVGIPYSAQYNASGGDGNYTYSLVSSLPPGLSLNSSTGLILGAPSQIGGWFGIRVRVTDGTGLSAVSNAFGITVLGAIVVSGDPQTSTDVNVPYVAQWVAGGGNPANYSWSLSGTLPSGLSFNSSTGTIAGTPTQVGTFGPLAVTVSDGQASGAAAEFSLVVKPTATPVVVTLTDVYVGGNGPLAQGSQARAGQSWLQYYTVSGGAPVNGNYSVSVVGNIPGNWSTSVSQDHFGWGNPSAGMEGTYGPFQIKAVDSQGQIGYSAPFYITMVSRLQIVSTPPNPHVDIPILFDMGATGGRPPYHWFVSDSHGDPLTVNGQDASEMLIYEMGPNFPIPKLTLTDYGSIWGRIMGVAPSEGRLYTAITVKDADGLTDTLDITWDITTTIARPQVYGTPIPDAYENTLYFPDSYYIVGGSPPYACSLNSGTLPSGISIVSDTVAKCAFRGTPTTNSNGVYPNISMKITDNAGSELTTKPFTLTVYKVSLAPIAIDGSNVPSTGNLNHPYFGQVKVTGGYPGYTFSVAAGSMPPGLMLDNVTGNITGTPSLTGTYPGIQIRVTDSNGATAITPAFTIEIGNDPCAGGVCQ